MCSARSPRQRDVRDPQAVADRLPAGPDRAAVDAGGLRARDVDRDPEHLARAGLRLRRDRDERIRDIAQQPVGDGARRVADGHRELAPDRDGAREPRSRGPGQSAGLGLRLGAAVDDELEGGAPAARGHEGGPPRRRLVVSWSLT